MRISSRKYSGWRTATLCAAVLVGMAVVAGCGSHQQAANPTDEGMKKAAALYNHFMRNHRGQGPASEEEFNKHLATLSKKDLEEMKIDNIEEAMKSPRDGQRYGIVYGVNNRTPGGSTPGKTGASGGASENKAPQAPKQLVRKSFSTRRPATAGSVLRCLLHGRQRRGDHRRGV